MEFSGHFPDSQMTCLLHHVFKRKKIFFFFSSLTGRRKEGAEPGLGRCMCSGAREEVKGRRKGKWKREAG